MTPSPNIRPLTAAQKAEVEEKKAKILSILQQLMNEKVQFLFTAAIPHTTEMLTGTGGKFSEDEARDFLVAASRHLDKLLNGHHKDLKEMRPKKEGE